MGLQSVLLLQNFIHRIRRFYKTNNNLEVLPDNYLSESRQDLVSKSSNRWLQAEPDLHLSWAREISGKAFIEKVLKYGAINPSEDILEIGPGYGRLLKALLKENAPFNSYCGIDISSKNVDYLKRTFSKPNLTFVQGNIEEVVLDAAYDIVISSLTFKHIFPSFGKALINVERYMKKNAVIFFDVIEGNKAYFENGDTYIRCYTRKQLAELVQDANLELIKFDNVKHAPGYTRLLVIARKPGQ